MKRFNLLFLLMYLGGCLVSYAQTVPVGNGSYTTVFPGTDAAGRNLIPSGTPQLSGVAATKPVPTNDWWSNFIKVDHGGQAFNYPLSFRSKPQGLNVNYTIPPSAGPTEYRQPMSDVEGIVVGVDGLNASRSTAADHSDWTVTMNWNAAGKDFSATMGIGMPFVYFTKGSTDVAKVAVNFNAPGATVSGNKIIIRNNYSNANYVVYGPAGTVWTNNAGVFTSTLNGKNYWSMVMLPFGVDVNTAVAALEQYAYVFPGNTAVAWNYNASTGKVRTTFTVTPVVKEGTFTTILQGLLPHQWSKLASDSPVPASYTYASVRGQLKMLSSNTFIVENRFSGILPTLPNLAKYSNGFDPASLYKKIDLMKGDGLPEWTDSYNEGQNMNRLIQAAHIAHQIGYTQARDQLVNTVKLRLEDWFKAEQSEVAFLFYYNNDWKALIGYPAGHRQDQNLNDHHFHWGYFIHAAAAIEQYQPGWAAQWGPMVNLLVRDAANPSRTDTMFPFLRNFSPYAGHSWANGFATEPFGNDQESTSESMQFNSSLIHWGTITGNTAIRDLGIYLYTTEQSAVEEYWFDINDRTFQPEYQHEMVARVWGAGYDNGTWWTQDIAASYGIQLYPIHGGALYMGHNTAYVQKVWEGMKAKTQVLSNTPNDNLWYDTYWSYLSFLDPQKAIELYNAYTNRNVKVGISDAQTYHWLHTMNAMGQVMEEVTANYPVAAVFNKAGVKTYVAHNYSASAITVAFSDGFTLSVPARSTATNRDISATVSLTSNVVQVPSGGSVTLSATVAGSGVSKVEFYRNSTLLGSDASAPYSIIASGLAAGLPGFYAKAFVGTNTAVSTIVTVQVGSQVPYSGTPIAIPGTIEAGNYDVFEGGSGQGVSYSDATPWNEGGFRPNEAVDAGPTANEGNTVGWVDAGEWLEYTVNVAQAGTYDVNIRYTSGNNAGGGPFWFEREDGTKISPNSTVALNDVNWSTYANKLVQNVTLAAGRQVIRFKVENGGFNFGRMTFTYTGIANVSPTVNITAPANGATFTAPASITITANVADSDGTVSSVAFYNGNTLLGTDTSSPYSFTWSNVPLGTYSITARATDNGGATKTSSAIGVTVNGTPGAPIPGTIQAETHSAMSGIATETTTDVDGGLNVGWIDSGDYMDYAVNVGSAGMYTVGFRVASLSGGGQVQLRSGTTVLATVTIGATNGWQTWTTLTTNVTLAAGSQTVRLYASAGGFNLNWMQFSASNTPPTVSITSPANGATYTAPATMTINANAADANGTVSSVAFYNGSTLLGTDTSSPYSYTWANVAAGVYSITARATDNAGAVTTSSGVSVTVNEGGGVCKGTAANGDYKYEVSTGSGNVSWTFLPQAPIAGSTLCILYVKVGSGGYVGYSMNASGANFTYSGAYPAAQALTFYFTYRIGNTTNERNSSANPHAYTVGTTCVARLADVPVENALDVYPNPAYQKLHLTDVQALKGAEIRIVDALGRDVLKEILESSVVDVATLPAGVYSILIRQGNRVSFKRFIKK